MIKLLYILFFYTVCYAVEYSKFPLINSNTTWIVAQKNRESRLLWQSVHEFDATHIARIQFLKDRIVLGWANLNHRDYSCTSDMLQDAVHQMDSTQVSDALINGQFKYLNIDYRDMSDTLWHCRLDIQKAFLHGYSKIYRVKGFNSTVPTKTIVDDNGITLFNRAYIYEAGRDTVYYSNDIPVLYGLRRADSREFTYYDSATTFYYRSFDEMQSDFPDFMCSSGVLEKIAVTDFDVTKKGYWQVHIHPEEVWFPRNPMNGEPIKDPGVGLKPTAMSFDTAIAMKKKSLASPNDPRLTYYRNPYFDDSASTIISFAFVDNSVPGDPMCNRAYVDLTTGVEVSEDGTKDLGLSHFPPRMVGYQQWDYSNIYKYMLEMYSTNEKEDNLIENMNSKCLNWVQTDINNSTFVFQNDGNGRLSRIDSVPLDIWWYDGCPCSKVPQVKNLTPLEMQRFAYKLFPTCSMADLRKYQSILKQLKEYLTNSNDQKRINSQLILSEEILSQRLSGFRDKNGAVNNALLQRSVAAENTFCDETWVRRW
ncbi:MAG: hypothetical protein GX640_04195 [Fibrobacter sp.]|nr:hypothetical protein [Fibrobacter sp.]